MFNFSISLTKCIYRAPLEHNLEILQKWLELMNTISRNNVNFEFMKFCMLFLKQMSLLFENSNIIFRSAFIERRDVLRLKFTTEFNNGTLTERDAQQIFKYFPVLN